MARITWPVICLIAIGCASCHKQNQSVSIQFRIAEEQPAEGLTEKIFSGWGTQKTFYLHDEVLLAEEDIVSASVIMLREHPAVEVVFSEAGREQFAQLTEENVGKRLGMVIEGKLVCAPMIRAPITTGKAIIEGDLLPDEAQRIARGLLRK